MCSAITLLQPKEMSRASAYAWNRFEISHIPTTFSWKVIVKMRYKGKSIDFRMMSGHISYLTPKRYFPHRYTWTHYIWFSVDEIMWVFYYFICCLISCLLLFAVHVSLGSSASFYLDILLNVCLINSLRFWVLTRH